MPFLFRLGCRLLFAFTLLVALPASAQVWVSTWESAHFDVESSLPLGTGGITYREIVHVSAGGSQVRITLSNIYGLNNLVVSAASIARAEINNSGTASQIATGDTFKSDGTYTQPTSITFSGKDGNGNIQSQASSFAIGKGQYETSDAVDMTVQPGEDLAISLYFDPSNPINGYGKGYTRSAQFSVENQGDLTKTAQFSTFSNLQSDVAAFPFLTGVSVYTAPPNGTIVCLGDSITYGKDSSAQLNRSYPSDLAVMLQKSGSLLAVANAGLAGNEVMTVADPTKVKPGTGPSAIKRFERDVLVRDDVQHIILLEGINDITANVKATCNTTVAACGSQIADLEKSLEAAYTDLANTAHDQTPKIKIFGGTLTPFPIGGEVVERVRQDINIWIRNHGPSTKPLVYDGIIDFDQAVSANYKEVVEYSGGQPSATAETWISGTNSGDNLHPSDTGYLDMAKQIHLSLFK